MIERRTLFSYKVATDAGSAPNPYWGTCTLAICKPRIRSAARVGDWIVGLGVRAREGRVIYAMRVTDKMPMEQYDAWTRKHLPQKIPDLRSRDRRRWFGDSIYDFERGGALRRGVHDEGDRAKDMSGRYVLLSDHFYYFGSEAIPLPEELAGIRIRAQGHRSVANAPYVENFVEWIKTLDVPSCEVLGAPADADAIFEARMEGLVQVGRCKPD